jgi:hypothetical protein
MFHRAVEEYGWTASEAAVTIASGLEYEMRRRLGATQDVLLRHRPLTTLKAWKKIHDQA